MSNSKLSPVRILKSSPNSTNSQNVGNGEGENVLLEIPYDHFKNLEAPFEQEGITMKFSGFFILMVIPPSGERFFYKSPSSEIGTPTRILEVNSIIWPKGTKLRAVEAVYGFFEHFKEITPDSPVILKNETGKQLHCTIEGGGIKLSTYLSTNRYLLQAILGTPTTSIGIDWSQGNYNDISFFLGDRAGEIYALKNEGNKRFSPNSGFERIPNASANRFSYDPLRITPAKLDETVDEGGGMMKQIFEDLKEDDTDWHQGDGTYVTKNHFDVTALNTKLGIRDEKVVYGGNEFMSEISSSVELGGEVGGGFPIPKVGSASAGVSLEKMSGIKLGSENAFSYNSMFSILKIDKECYKISLDKQNSDFTKEFVDDVIKINNDKDADDFIKNWGTHYAEKVTYGGYCWAIMQESIQEYQQSRHTEKDFSTAIKSVVTSEVVNTSSSYKKIQNEKEGTSITVGGKNGKAFFFYRGGSGNDESWDVEDGNAAAVKTKLSPIFSLIEFNTFNKRKYREETQPTEKEIEQKKELLKEATRRYLTGKNYIEPIKPYYYEISLQKLILNLAYMDYTNRGYCVLNSSYRVFSKSGNLNTSSSKEDFGGNNYFEFKEIRNVQNRDTVDTSNINTLLTFYPNKSSKLNDKLYISYMLGVKPDKNSTPDKNNHFAHIGMNKAYQGDNKFYFYTKNDFSDKGEDFIELDKLQPGENLFYSKYKGGGSVSMYDIDFVIKINKIGIR